MFMNYFFIAAIVVHLIVVGLVCQELKVGERWRVIVYPLIFVLNSSHFKSKKGVVYHTAFYLTWIVFISVLVFLNL